MSARVVDRPAQLDRRGGQVAAVGDVSAAAGIDLDLQGNAQLAAIADQALVVAGNTGRAGVEVEAVGESRGLVGLAAHLDPGPATDAPVASADPVARLQHRDIE